MSLSTSGERAATSDATELLSRVFAPRAAQTDWLRRPDLTAQLLACAGGEPASSRAVREVAAELTAAKVTRARAPDGAASTEAGGDERGASRSPVLARLLEERAAFEEACNHTWRSPTRPRAALGDSLGALGPGSPRGSPSKNYLISLGSQVGGLGSRTESAGITAVEQAMLDCVRARVKGALDSGKWI